MPRLHLVLISIVAALTAAIVLVSFFIWQALQLSPSELEPTAAAPEEAVTAPATDNPTIIGRSVENRVIEVYTFGTGSIDLLFVGGMHGGYEWNSSLLAWEMIDYFTETPAAIPGTYTVHIIPTLNPDGLAEVVGTGGRFLRMDVPNPDTRLATARFNANNVDLNRNFACNWAPESTWRGQTVSAGTAPFSEPEATALRDYVMRTQPTAVAFWHSQASNVYGSACGDGVLPRTTTLGAAYADAASYGYVDFFDAYPITGDAEGWLASIGIPAVTVELEEFGQTEFQRNLAGVQSWLNHFVAKNPTTQ